MKRATITFLALALLAGILASASAAPVPNKQTADSTPGSCDNQPVGFHRHRARSLIKVAYSFDRYPAKDPAKTSEKHAWRSHKRCIRIPSIRKEIAGFQDAKAKQYATKRESDWCAPHPAPDGDGCWVIPVGCVESESGGSWTAANPTSDARGPYQLLGHGEPWPVTTRAQAMEHHRIAAALYASSGLGPWTGSGC